MKCHALSFPSTQDMIFFINQKGPVTEGISQKPGNVNSCRALKERLNSGLQVDLDGKFIFVTASVLKVGNVTASSR
jgi:hypothetical protein